MSVLADRTFTTMKSEKNSVTGTNSLEDKKMKKITFAILAIAFIAAFNSCKEEQEIQTPDEEDDWEYFAQQYDKDTPRTPGSFVMFGANTYYNTGVETRTSYSDAEFTVGESRKERIDWVEGDNIQVFCNQSSAALDAEYSVYNHQVGENPVQSVAPVHLVSAQGLKWGTTDPHIFHGIYPKENTIALNSTSTAQYPSVTNRNETTGGYTGSSLKFITCVPARQPYPVDMNLAGMVATTIAPLSDKGNVTMVFYPIVTTLQFDLKNVSKKDIKINEIFIDGPDVAGKYDVEVTDEDQVSFALAEDKQHQASVVGINKTLATGSNETVRVVLFALPMEFTNAKLGIRMTIEGMEVTRKVALNYKKADGTKEFITFQPTHKYNFTIEIPESIVFEVDPHLYQYDVNGGTDRIKINSFTYNALGEKTPVAWTATRYSIDGKEIGAEDKEWKTFNASVLTPDQYGILPTMLEGWNVFSTVGATNPTCETSVGEVVAYNKPPYRKLKEATPAVDVDLSLRDVNGNVTARNTANCYMVHACGTYKFPIVYGNAIKNGVTNTMAFMPTYHDRSQAEITDSLSYTPVAGDDNLGWNHTNPFISHFLSPFVDSQQNDITQPKIGGVTDVKLVWQDAKGLITSVGLSADSEFNYVTFTVTDDMKDLVEGNALIAVTNENDDILWSWHIWITEMTGENNISTSSSSLMSKKLVDNAIAGVTGANIGAYVGFCDLSVGPREILIEFEQAETGYKDYLTLTQKGRFDGNAPLYQYGRKDPLQAQSGLYEGEGRWSDKPFYDIENGPANMTILGRDVFGTSGKRVLAQCILNPNTFCLNTDGTHSMDDMYYNLWAAHNTRIGLKDKILKNGTAPARIDKSKTIYDPCPAGYRVPSFEDVEPWRRYVSYSNEDEHYAIFTLGGNRVYLPAIAGKLFSNGSYGTKWWQLWEFSSWVSNPNCYSIVASVPQGSTIEGYNKGAHIPEAVFWRNTGNCLSRWVVAGQTCYQIRFDYNTCWMNESGATRANASNIIMIQESASDSYYIVSEPSTE